MLRHSRKLALLAILLTGGLGVAALAAGGLLSARGGNQSMDQLEREIAKGNADAATWQRYGDTLREAHRYTHAAEAYRRALTIEPNRREARINAALTLAQAADADGFFTLLQQITANEPKLAVDLLARPETDAMRKDARWDTTVRIAKAQAAD